ncbi:putative ankyrin repeat-containing domain, PGG domain, ankyrin repeat-containing domain superfamily [Helianthus annuus]|nr:putative ankyrin repeat-containing domain, PGG domain, ankyrin repeat-containing domain superfamily [Helianthus annuus]
MDATKEHNLKTNKALYEAMMDQNDDEVIRICRGIAKGALHTLTIHGDTVLHVAIYQKQTKLALRLLDMVPPSDNYKLTWTNHGGNTVLHETGTNNKTVPVAEEILRRAPMLLDMTNREGETALFYAARHGKTKPYMFLHDEFCKGIDGQDLTDLLRRDDRFTMLHLAVLSRNYRVAYDIAVNHNDLIPEKDAEGMTALQLLSIIQPEIKPKSSFKRFMFKLVQSDPNPPRYIIHDIKRLKKEKYASEWALKLAVLLIEKDNSWKMTESWTENRGSRFRDYKAEQKTITTLEGSHDLNADTPLLLATRFDSTDIVKEILRMYPQAVEHVDKEGHSVLHLAILHRRIEIIDIVENMKFPLERLRGKLDKNYNTLLHMVGYKEDHLKEDIRHPAKELKDDQLLYKRVEKLTTTLDKSTRNAEQKTPLQVFYEANEQLRTEAKDWMVENATNCSIVAVLIATVAFTSAYQVPGGPDDFGHPKLKDKSMFVLFTLADAISLSTALTSVIVFLNIATSPFHFKDFESHLFEKQLLGLILLITSVAMMMVAFAATLVLTISNKGKWSDLTLYVVSFFPVLVFMYSYLSYYMDMIVNSFRELKKMIGQTVIWFRKIWEYKPQSTHPIDGLGYSRSRSPV